MSEQEDLGQERTEAPTSKRKEDARRNGQTLRSKDLNTSIIVLSSLILFYAFFTKILNSMKELFYACLSLTRNEVWNTEQMMALISESMVNALISIVPFLGLIVIAALVGPILLGGVIFSLENIMFKIERLYPAEGLKRIMSMKLFVEILKSLLKIAILLVAFFLAINTYKYSIYELNNYDHFRGMNDGMYLLFIVTLLTSLALFIVAVVDVPYQMWAHLQKLKMTKKEVRDELKDSAGGAQIRRRVGAKSKGAKQQYSIIDAKNADVIITDMSTFSVAIKYDKNPTSVPIVLAKGKHSIAKAIKKIAADNNIMIVEKPSLARSLYDLVDIGVEIPNKLFEGVVDVLSYVYEHRSHDKININPSE